MFALFVITQVQNFGQLSEKDCARKRPDFVFFFRVSLLIRGMILLHFCVRVILLLSILQQQDRLGVDTIEPL
jgi:hypothetical protein